MPKISDIHYCTNCGYKMFWECPITMQTYGVDIYSIMEDTYKPQLLKLDGQIAKLRFTCERCGQLDDISYEIDKSCKY